MRYQWRAISEKGITVYFSDLAQVNSYITIERKIHDGYHIFKLQPHKISL